MNGVITVGRNRQYKSGKKQSGKCNRNKLIKVTERLRQSPHLMNVQELSEAFFCMG